MITKMWRRVVNGRPSRDDMKRPPHPRVECPVCGQRVATTSRSVEEVTAALLKGEPIRLVAHAPCKYAEDDTREINRGDLGGRT